LNTIALYDRLPEHLIREDALRSIMFKGVGYIASSGTRTLPARARGAAQINGLVLSAITSSNARMRSRRNPMIEQQ
jgi:hypothetical protein